MRRADRAAIVIVIAAVISMVPVVASAFESFTLDSSAEAGVPGERLASDSAVPLPTKAVGPPPPSTYEPRTTCIRGDLGFMNAARKAQGLSELVWDEELFKTACAQAYYMAYYERLTHWVYGSQRPFLAENVGFDTSIDELCTAWLTSPLHRSIILDPGRRGGAAIAYVTTPYGKRQLYWGVIHFT